MYTSLKFRMSPSLLMLALASTVVCIPERNSLNLKIHLGLLNIKEWVNRKMLFSVSFPNGGWGSKGE